MEWNHFDSSKFAACGSKLEYFEIYNDSSNKRNAKVINVREISQITCAQWYPRADRPHLMAYGCVNSVVGLLEWPHADRPGSEKILNPAAKLRKPCSGLSWNLFTPNQLASSFEKQKGDYCTVVWDIGCGQEIVKL